MRYRYLFLGIVLLGIQVQAQNVVETTPDSVQVVVASQPVEESDTIEGNLGSTVQDSLRAARRSPISQSAMARKAGSDAFEAPKDKGFWGTMVQNMSRSDSSWLYLLQQPRVSKRFKEKKKFGDHLFLEMGGGVSTVFTRGTSSKMDKIGGIGNVAIGDWITPEHGVRLGFSAGEYRIWKTNSRAISFAADYMMNFSAVGSRSYEKPDPIEYYGIMGLELNYSNSLSGNVAPSLQKNLLGWGLRFGLRTQFRISDYTYAYVEPRLGFYSDELLHAETYRGIRPIGSVLAGVGYRMQPVDYRKRFDYDADGSFLNDMFISVWGGPHWLLKELEDMNDNFGGRFGISAGKWFNHLHGARINAQVSKGRNQNGHHYYRKFKTLTLGADYMLNLHNAFAGYDPERKYWVNALAGFSLNYSSGVHGHKPSVGFGGGLQANVRIAHGTDFFLEPRIDIYSQGYATNFTTFKNNDAVASLLAGFAFRQGLDTKTQRQRNEDFKNNTWFDNLIFEGGMGAVIPAHSYSFDHISKFFSPKAFMGVGKWFTPTSGARLWAEAGVVKSNMVNIEKVRTVSFGADYMWNATNTFHGYDPERMLEVVTTLGVNYSRQPEGNSFFGTNASVKGLLHINKMWSLFLEPQARLYKKGYLTASTPGFAGDLILATVAGVQIRANGYRPNIDSGTFAEEDNHSFVSLGFGTAIHGDELRWNKQYGFAGRLGYGRWFHPAAAWRANLGLFNRSSSMHYFKATLGGDILFDVDAVNYGYNSDRLFSTRVLAGVNLGMDFYSGTDNETNFMPDVHVGTQFAFRVSPKVELFAEPQLAYMFLDSPSGRVGNLSKFQPSLVAGITVRRGKTERQEESDITEFENKTWYDNFEFQAGMGALMPANSYTFSRMSKFITPKVFMSIGKWFTATSGVRLWGEAGAVKTNFDHPMRYSTIGVGADYMFNILNAFRGYNPERPFDLVTAIGVNHSRQNLNGGGHFGFNASAKGSYRINNLWGVFVEPQLRFYGEDYINATTSTFHPAINSHIIASLVAGVQIRANGYRPKIDCGTYEEEGNRSFISLGLGTAANADELRWKEQYGFAGRMSYGHWFHPVAAWRANLEGFYRTFGVNGRRYAKAMLGADLLFDVNAATFGFDSERVFSTRLIGGANLGIEHISGGAKSGFIPDVHTGAQFAFRVSPTVELYAEPVLSYQFKQPLGRIGNISKFQPKVYAGINYRFGGADGTSYKNVEKREKKQFVSAAIGTGLNTLNYGYYDGKRMTFTADITYGRWFSNISAIRAGLSHTSVPFEPLANRQLSSLHVDYMADLTAIATGESSEDKIFRLYGFAGIVASTCYHKEHDERKWGFGGQAGFQLAFRVAPAFEVFAEPVVHVMSKSVVLDYFRHPAEADLKLMLGTKFSF